MELRRLRYFAVLAEELHFGEAARKLHIAQPGLSQQIKALENELKVELFHRTSRAVSLTPAGEVLAEEVRHLLEHADQVEEKVRAFASGTRGILRILFTRSAPGDKSYHLVERFKSAHPEVEVLTETAWTAWNLESLRNRKVDAVVVLLPLEEKPDDLEVLPLGEEALSVALPPGHPLAGKPHIRRADLRGEPAVLWPRTLAPGAYDRLIEDLWPDQEDLPIARAEPDMERMLAAVQAGAGFTLLSSARASHLHLPGVALRSFTGPAPVYRFGLCWLRDTSNPAVARFVRLVRGPGRQPDTLLPWLPSPAVSGQPTVTDRPAAQPRGAR
jgi:DNA-binding transcriptional LysR family regulator